jgi:hypothetical protein
VTGTVPCELFENHELRTLMFSINKLEGSLPACVLAVSICFHIEGFEFK